MKTIIVDTNAFLRFFLNDIPSQKKIVEKLFQEAEKSQSTLLVPQIIIFELHFILDKYYHFKKEKIIETLTILVATDFLSIESREMFLEALTLYSKVNVSFADCFLLVKARSESAELFTFDKRLEKLSS